MSNFKRKYKFFKIYLAVSIVFTNFHFFDFLSKKPNFLSYNKHFEFSNDDETQSNIAKSKNNFSWLEKYQNDKNFINSDFNAYISGRLIEKVLIDRIFSLAKIAFLHHFQEYVLSCYNGNLKFAYTSYRSGFISFIMSMFYSPNEDSKLKIIQFDSNYFQLCAEKLDLDAIFDLNEFNFVLQANHKNDFCEDIVSSFFSDQINGIYYVNENDKNDENNEVNKKVKDKIKQLKTKMNHAKKQLRVFHHSLSQPTLQLNDEISELNSYLAKMVVKMHELFDHTAVNKEIYDKSISEIMIEDNIRNLFFVWIKNFSIRDSLAYEDLPWFMCKHDDFFSYLTFHKKKYANGENINFKSAIADFLSLVKSNYTITTFEKAVASYIFATRNNKTIISCSSWTWKNWEEWIFQNWNTIMEGSAITVGAFIAFFYLPLSLINSIFFWPFRKLINVLPAKINEEKSDVPLFPKSFSWPNNAVTLKNIFDLYSSLTTMNKITNNNLVDVFENGNNILSAVDFGLALNNFLKFVTKKQYQNIDSIKSLSYREIFEMIEKETNEEEEMESADPIEINIEEASMEQIFSLPWSRGEDKGIFEKITKFNNWINGENDSWFDYLKKKWWEFRWKIKPKVKKFLKINNDKFPTLYYFNSRLWICNNDVLQNICNEENFSKYRGKGLIPFEWILLPILKLFSKSWNFLSIDELISMIISYFKIENIDKKGISEKIGKIFDNCKLEFSDIDGKTQFFKIESLPEQIINEIQKLDVLEENNINNDNNGFIADEVESSSIIILAIAKILMQKDEFYSSLPDYVLKNIVRFSFEKIVQEKGRRIFDKKELESSILQRINSIFKNKSFYYTHVDANGEQQFIPIFLPKIIQKKLSKKIVDDSKEFVKLNDIVLAIIEILKNDKSFSNLDVNKWNDFKPLVENCLKNYFIKEIKIKKQFNNKELKITFSTNEAKNESTAIEELIKSFIDMSENIKIMIGYDSLLTQYIFYTKSEYLPPSIREQICIDNEENIKDGITIQFDSVVKAIIEILKEDKRFRALSPKKLETIIEFYYYSALKEFICMQSNTIVNDNTISIVNFDTNKNYIENINLEKENDNKDNNVRDNITKVVAEFSINIDFEKNDTKIIKSGNNDEINDGIINESDENRESIKNYVKKEINCLLNNTKFVIRKEVAGMSEGYEEDTYYFLCKSLPEKILSKLSLLCTLFPDFPKEIFRKNIKLSEITEDQEIEYSDLVRAITLILCDNQSIKDNYPLNYNLNYNNDLFHIVKDTVSNLIENYAKDAKDSQFIIEIENNNIEENLKKIKRSNIENITNIEQNKSSKKKENVNKNANKNANEHKDRVKLNKKFNEKETTCTIKEYLQSLKMLRKHVKLMNGEQTVDQSDCLSLLRKESCWHSRKIYSTPMSSYIKKLLGDCVIINDNTSCHNKFYFEHNSLPAKIKENFYFKSLPAEERDSSLAIANIISKILQKEEDEKIYPWLKYFKLAPLKEEIVLEQLNILYHPKYSINKNIAGIIIQLLNRKQFRKITNVADRETYYEVKIDPSNSNSSDGAKMIKTSEDKKENWMKFDDLINQITKRVYVEFLGNKPKLTSNEIVKKRWSIIDSLKGKHIFEKKIKDVCYYLLWIFESKNNIKMKNMFVPSRLVCELQSNGNNEIYKSILNYFSFNDEIWRDYSKQKNGCDFLRYLENKNNANNNIVDAKNITNDFCSEKEEKKIIEEEFDLENYIVHSWD